MEVVSFLNGRGQRISGALHMPAAPAGPAVVIAHGLGGSKEDWAEFSEEMSSVGFLVLRFDFSGFGSSEGDSREMTVGRESDDLRSAVGFLRGRFHISELILMGFSLGCMSVIKCRDLADRLVMLSPVLRPQDVYRMFGPKWQAAGEEGSFRTDWGAELGYGFLIEMRDMDFEGEVRSVYKDALAVIAGRDSLVDSAYNERLCRSLKRCEVDVFPNADHVFSDPVDQAAMVASVMRWLRRQRPV